jgi:tryptophan synthase beta subunit
MKLLGAEVVAVTQGQGTLKDAVDVALGALISQPSAYYLLGSVVGPHPYPLMVRLFQQIIGEEAIAQHQKLIGKLPVAVVACVGGGSNALGLFAAFIAQKQVKIVAAEPAGLGRNTDRHGLSLMCGQPGIIHGFKTRVLQTAAGEIKESYSAASGLDYPGVGPELSQLYDAGRLTVLPVTDAEAVKAMTRLSRTEGIIPALESAHALAAGLQVAAKLKPSESIIINLSGRGDKDVGHIMTEFPDQIEGTSV